MHDEQGAEMKKLPFISGIVIGLVLAGILSIVLRGAAGLIKYATQQNTTQSVESQSSETSVAAPTYNEFKDKIEDIDSILEQTYYEGYDQNGMWEGAYEGYVAGIGDPYTTYFTKDQFNSFMEDTSGSYEGIGVVVSFDETGDNVLVVAPFAGSPGETAGVLPGDYILKVDETDIAGMTLEEVVKLIKGEKGTQVVLSIYREDTKEFKDLTITRDVINQETIAYEMLEDSIGYIQITGFQEVTYDQFMVAYNELEAQGQKGLIIDLRNNPGGLVNIVADISDELLPEGLIVYTEDKFGNREEIKSDAANKFDKPLVVLVNENSASASEILSGAVQDHEVGTIVGTTTFGKGLVQGTFPLEDGSALKVTVAKYFTPDGNYIHEKGIVPDVVIELPEELQNQYYIERDVDVQFQKALEVMESEIK